LNFIGIKAAATALGFEHAWQAPRPAIPTLQGWDISVLHEAAPSARVSVRSTAGCKTGLIRTHANAPSSLLVTIRR
jgi:hypothetical protein